jgi:hypothetical protein
VRLVTPPSPTWAPETRMSHPALPDGVREMLDRGFGAEPGPRDQGHTPACSRLREDAEAELRNYTPG